MTDPVSPAAGWKLTLSIRSEPIVEFVAPLNSKKSSLFHLSADSKMLVKTLCIADIGTDPDTAANFDPTPRMPVSEACARPPAGPKPRTLWQRLRGAGAKP